MSPVDGRVYGGLVLCHWWPVEFSEDWYCVSDGQ